MITIFPDSLPGSDDPRRATIHTTMEHVHRAAEANAGTGLAAAWTTIGNVLRLITTITPLPPPAIANPTDRAIPQFTVTTACGCKLDMRLYEPVRMALPSADTATDIVAMVPLSQFHCDHGIGSECADCPVALALTEGTGKPWNIYSAVGGDLYADEDTLQNYNYTLSDTLQEMIKGFDDEAIALTPGTLLIDRQIKHIDFAPNA